MTFTEKQQNLVQAIENYVSDETTKSQLDAIVSELLSDENFKSIELFNNILTELQSSLHELSRKELKQRILLINSYF